MKIPKIFLRFMTTAYLKEENELALWYEDWDRYDYTLKLLMSKA